MEVYGTNIDRGLSVREIPLKKRLFGDNRLEEAKGLSPIAIFVSQFKDFMTMVLMAATVVSASMGEVADSIAIAAIVLINGLLGFIQEYKTEKSLKALKELAAPTAKVLRDGAVLVIPAGDLVPGDIVMLESGDRVPADGDFVKVEALQIDESILTGESRPVQKTTEKSPGEDIRIHGKNHGFMGTSVILGRGKMIVTHIGMDTEMGKIAGMIGKIEAEETPLQRRLDHFGKQLVGICIFICAVVALLGVARGEKAQDMFMFGVSLAVAAIPEGLPAIVTVVLTLGVQRMIKKHVVVRKLPAVETLGCATVICSDKTGTLTENRMSARKLFINNEFHTVSGTGHRGEGEIFSPEGAAIKKIPEDLKKMFVIGVCCNNAGIARGVKNFLDNLTGARELDTYGDPTEIAILIAAFKGGVIKDVEDKNFVRLKEFPFDSDRKRMSVLVKDARGNLFLFVKGAPDVVMSLCTHIEDNGQVKPLSPHIEKTIVEANESMGSDALRVLSFAYKKVSMTQIGETDMEQGLTFLGMMGMIDPPRPEAIPAVQKCLTSGIRPVMITGDHKTTAWAVARELSMVGKTGRVMTGKEMDGIGEAELAKCIDDITVFARVTPRHKLRIVKTLKKLGHVVAMTGDGVNDAPAVKEADIGVAMGITGTDVTKEASAMILMDDNFASIVAAVEEGRIIYDNIRKFIRYLLSCNTGEVLTMLWATVLGLPLPLLPIQILWMNLVTDGLPAMALGIDPPEKGVMNKRPRGKSESIFSRGLGTMILRRGIFISIATVATFIFAGIFGHEDLAMARTAAFSTLVFSQLIFVFECRSENARGFGPNPFSNLYLVFAVVASVLMQLTVIYIPFFRPIFHTVPLEPGMWMLVVGLAGLSAVF